MEKTNVDIFDAHNFDLDINVDTIQVSQRLMSLSPKKSVIKAFILMGHLFCARYHYPVTYMCTEFMSQEN